MVGFVIFHLKIEDFAVNMDIGVYNWERVVKQRVLVCIDLSYTCVDKVIIDYAALGSTVAGFLTNRKYDFLEDAARGLVNFLKAEYENVMTKCSVRMHKERPSLSKNCRKNSVVVEWQKTESGSCWWRKETLS